WIWFDLTCESETTVHSAGWYPAKPAEGQLLQCPAVVRDADTAAATHLNPGDQLPAAEPRVTVGIPTFNRPADAVAALEALASDPEVGKGIDAVIMPDQGDKHPADAPGIPAGREHFGAHLRTGPQGHRGATGRQRALRLQAAHRAAGQSRRLRRLLPHHVRGTP